MERFTITDRRLARGIGLIATITTALATGAIGPSYVPLGKALVFGALGVVCINVVVFCINLLSSMRQWKHSSSEAQLAEIAVPALRGRLSAIGSRTVRISAFLLMACVGICAGAIVATFIHFAIQLVRP